MAKAEFLNILQEIDDEHAAMDALVSYTESAREADRRLLLSSACNDEIVFVRPIIEEMQSALETRNIEIDIDRVIRDHSIELYLKFGRRTANNIIVSSLPAKIHLCGCRQFSIEIDGEKTACGASTIGAAAAALFRALYLDFDTQMMHAE